MEKIILKRIEHELDPFYQKDSQILILGTFPSPKSRESKFYYGHPQNRFWKVLSAVFNDFIPETISEKKNFLIKWKIALWDVISSCHIQGASDSSIRDVIYNDLHSIIDDASIKLIVTTGKKADLLFMKRWSQDRSIQKIAYLNLPSTSSANASISLKQLIQSYNQITNFSIK
jgi:TDG/mug DNA glycosylase family protein